MLQLWRITIRTLAYVPSQRHTHCKIIAILSRSERDAVAYVRTHIFTPQWWDEHLIIDVEPCGELWAAEGFSVPMEED